jgi:hypothetical protein
VELNAELKKPMLVWGDWAAAVGKSRHCPALEKLGARLKLTVSPRKKLISNFWACPLSGSGWQLLIYQPLTGPLLRTCLLHRPQSTKEPLAKTLRAEPTTQRYPIRNRNTHFHST